MSQEEYQRRVDRGQRRLDRVLQTCDTYSTSSSSDDEFDDDDYHQGAGEEDEGEGEMEDRGQKVEGSAEELDHHGRLDGEWEQEEEEETWEEEEEGNRVGDGGEGYQVVSVACGDSHTVAVLRNGLVVSSGYCSMKRAGWSGGCVLCVALGIGG